MKIVAIIQARMGSTRLPGKVLKDIGGETMLARVVRRTQSARLLDQIVVATTTEYPDDAIVPECNRLAVDVFRGDEQDVLDRFYQAAMAHSAEVIVRITSDCPFIDPGMVDKVLQTFLEKTPDYIGNTLLRAYPRGVMPEVLTMSALAQAWREADKSYQRVHVTPYVYQNPGCFDILAVSGAANLGDYRWTVDTLEDLEFARAVYARLSNDDSFSWLDILGLLEDNPELLDLNRHIKQKPLEEG
jgi:spore coat polysaccharide biosynthesis protein SpsF